MNAFTSLAVELTATGWTQLQTTGASPANYVAPTGYRADLGRWSIENLNGANVVVVQLAISPDNTPTNVQLLIGAGKEVSEGGSILDDDARELIPEGWALWANVVSGTSPDVVVRATVLEKALA